MRKYVAIIKEVLPILIMIGCIPFIENDVLLTLVYIGITVISFVVKKEKNDFLVYGIGFFGMTISESIFLMTGVEVFLRNSLFDIMPLWLPFLWAYGFVVMKRSIRILESKL